MSKFGDLKVLTLSKVNGALKRSEMLVCLPRLTHFTISYEVENMFASVGLDIMYPLADLEAGFEIELER